jgi:anti-sigma B factor antagonist
MEITRRTSADWTDLVVEGRLDGYWAEHLDAGIAEAIREGGLRLRLDLEKVTFLSSAGIGVLVKFHKRLTAVKGSLVIARLSAPVRTVLDMTRLTALLVATGEGGGEVTLTVGSTLSRHGLLCEVFDLNPRARMALTSIGGTHPVGSSEDRQAGLSTLPCRPSTTAIGIGAFGVADEEGTHRLGELLAVSGAAAYLPADGTEVPDYLVTSGGDPLDIRLSRGLACDGAFARHMRFEAIEKGDTVSLSTIATLTLELSGELSACVVAVVETTGLVGAALRQSPSDLDGDLFAFPDVRKRLTFTAERAFGGGLALIAGVVQRAGGPLPGAQLRPLDRESGLEGHFHAAAFAFRPFKKGRLPLPETVKSLFEDQPVQGVLHLLNDDRPVVGIGQSEFTRGACWFGAISA